ncbi:hypothetical protein Vafri_7416 [Volvox africanus]|uniref:HMG box domain-containing protein n=1 Tax=Volvox africanus TaxID=51714 RepID=A0A8J4EZ74_9CHLO|nr:hypothetical protein Vafri_7416 [Volvox africanus]
MAPPTAYMLFCNEHREAARQKLIAAGHEKVAVTLVAKELGQLWKALSDEEKAAYKSRAGNLQQAVDGDAQPVFLDGESQQEVVNAAKPAALPTAWVRRVVGLDPEIQRCSADAVLALSTAAEVFVAAICAKATVVAAGSKRRTVRLEDIERCVRNDKRLIAVGLTAVMNMVSAAVSSTEEVKAGQPENKRPRLEKAAVGINNSIERAFALAQS